MDIKKIFPFLSNVDFENPATKRNLFLAAGLIAGIIILVALQFIKQNNEEQSAQANTEITNSSQLTVPHGEVLDVTAKSGNTLAARNRLRSKQNPGLESIYENGVSDDDPLAFVTGKKTSAPAQESDSTQAQPTQEQEKPKVKKSHTKRQESKPQTPSVTQKTPSQGATSANMSDREKRRRAYFAARGVDPDTGLPIESNTTGGSQSGDNSSAEVQTPEQPNNDSQQEETIAQEIPTPTVTVRRSGEVSSLRKSVRSQNNSLRRKEMNVNTEGDHLLKVMFTSDERISSGQRVTLRLLEDMLVDGNLVPANTFLTAICSIGDRLSVSVNTIELGGKIYHLGYVGYDTDGAKGLYCPQTKQSKALEDVGKQGRQIGQQALSSRITNMAGQIINAGAAIFENIKGEVTIQVTSGYTFYLKQEKN